MVGKSLLLWQEFFFVCGLVVPERQFQMSLGCLKIYGCMKSILDSIVLKTLAKVDWKSNYKKHDYEKNCYQTKSAN